MHGTNAIAGPCEPTVLIGNLPAARVGDLTICGAPIAKGSMTVLIGNQLAARQGDITGHGGVIVKGEPTVLIGDQPARNACMASASSSGSAFVT
jgi:uncharacterized Zn-binding protein involved in type VI secretion